MHVFNYVKQKTKKKNTKILPIKNEWKFLIKTKIMNRCWTRDDHFNAASFDVHRTPWGTQHHSICTCIQGSLSKITQLIIKWQKQDPQTIPGSETSGPDAQYPLKVIIYWTPHGQDFILESEPGAWDFNCFHLMQIILFFFLTCPSYTFHMLGCRYIFCIPETSQASWTFSASLADLIKLTS